MAESDDDLIGLQPAVWDLGPVPKEERENCPQCGRQCRREPEVTVIDPRTWERTITPGPLRCSHCRETKGHDHKTRSRVCDECKKAFQPIRINQRLCSPKCRTAAHLANLRTQTRIKSKTKTCKQCCKSYLPTANGSHYCSPACKSAARGCSPSACAVCQTLFYPISQTNIFCSRACWGKARSGRSVS